MGGEVEHGVVGARLVPIGVGDQRPGVVWNDQLRHALHELERAHQPVDPIGKRLARRGAGKRVARRAQRRHKHVRAPAVANADRGAGVVHEELLACAVHLTHRAAQRLRERTVMLEELRAPPGALARVRGDVLLPQQHQRHALAREFAMHAGKVRHHHLRMLGAAVEQSRLQRLLVHAGDRCPIGQTGRLSQAYVLGHNALGDVQRLRDSLVRQARVVLESKSFLNHA